MGEPKESMVGWVMVASQHWRQKLEECQGEDALYGVGKQMIEAIERLHDYYNNKLNFLRDEAHHTAVDHGFTHATVGEEIALMHSELSEALEDFRAGHAPSESWYLDKASGQITKERSPSFKPCGIPSEMADVIIRVLDFCGKHEIDIERAVAEKMLYNKSRPFRHGDKKL